MTAGSKYGSLLIYYYCLDPGRTELYSKETTAVLNQFLSAHYITLLIYSV